MGCYARRHSGRNIWSFMYASSAMDHFLFLNKKICDRFCRFFRAQCSALIASATDYLVTALILHGTSLPYVCSAFAGCLTGGVCNCIINYKWVFRINRGNKLQIALRYLFVWIVSLLLNTCGTTLLGNFWLHVQNDIFDSPEQIFLIARITVSVACALFWNYPMQQLFVYQIHQTKSTQDS